MPANSLLTASRKGILTGVAEKADRSLAYYLASDASQSNLYKGNIRSLQGTIQKVGNNAAALKNQVEADLFALYIGLYDAVSVTVTITDVAWDGSSRFNIQIDVILTQDGVQYSLGQLCQSINGVVQPLLNQNNG